MLKQLTRLWLTSVLMIGLCTIQAHAADMQHKIDINMATAKVLAKHLPGIGIKKATAIVSYRDVHGKFKTIEDLLKIKGIGKKVLSKIQSHIEIKQKG